MHLNSRAVNRQGAASLQLDHSATARTVQKARPYLVDRSLLWPHCRYEDSSTSLLPIYFPHPHPNPFIHPHADMRTWHLSRRDAAAPLPLVLVSARV